VTALVGIARDKGSPRTSFALDCPALNDLTRELLGWRPTQHGLLTDLKQGHYFATR
jgi:hypothetical protein